jgi:hypothetical protein
MNFSEQQIENLRNSVDDFLKLTPSDRRILLVSIYGRDDSLVYQPGNWLEFDASKIMNKLFRYYPESRTMDSRYGCITLAYLLMFFRIRTWRFSSRESNNWAFMEIFPWGCFNVSGKWNSFDGDPYNNFHDATIAGAEFNTFANQWAWGYPGVFVLDRLINTGFRTPGVTEKILMAFTERSYTAVGMGHIMALLKVSWDRNVGGDRDQHIVKFSKVLERKRLDDSDIVYKGILFLTCSSFTIAI